MQKLVFESAWDRTLAQKDRHEIERVFSEFVVERKVGQQAVNLKTAFNHKREFLVTVLLNNYSKVPMSLLGKKIVYKEGDQILGEFKSVYKLEVPAETSMPWTFIFPVGSLIDTPNGDSGELIIS
ncbi:SLAP domain-containing protein [Fictibacillus sp. NPDC058756]|uniref:SLAP domain-containing protein n=1 Tax=Fictibacillus sp. NPDC058756 TaxID=3346625 RepID=UPI0036997556